MSAPMSSAASTTPTAPGWFALRERWNAWRARRAEGAVPIRDWVSVGSSQPTRLSGFDQTLVWVAVALLLWGLVMVYSASIAMPDNPKFSRYYAHHFLSRHVLSIVIGLGGGGAGLPDSRGAPGTNQRRGCSLPCRWCCSSPVLIPFIGKGVNGARRWIADGCDEFSAL
jgi:cell division protein FtsW